MKGVVFYVVYFYTPSSGIQIDLQSGIYLCTDNTTWFRYIIHHDPEFPLCTEHQMKPEILLNSKPVR